MPRGARGGGGTSRLQPVSRDASFGSGASREPAASPPSRLAPLGRDLRSGSFKFAQVACSSAPTYLKAVPHESKDHLMKP